MPSSNGGSISTKRRPRVTELEDNLLWRAADLLGISSRDRIELRHRVAANPGTGET